MSACLNVKRALHEYPVQRWLSISKVSLSENVRGNECGFHGGDGSKKGYAVLKSTKIETAKTDKGYYW